jgi:hypothetical protein
MLRDFQQLKRHPVEAKPLDPKIALLRTWQSERLVRTYADLLADPRYKPAYLFFLNEVYAPRDFGQRDRDMVTVYDALQHILPDALIRPLALTVELHHLTEALDQRLIDVLTGQLGVTDTITTALYAEAYRICDNYDERVRQIDLVHQIGSRLDGVVSSPLTSAMLAVSKGPARAAGWGELTDFLEKGYRAFKHMRGARHFLDTVRERELRILDRIYASDPDPFEFESEVTPSAE